MNATQNATPPITSFFGEYRFLSNFFPYGPERETVERLYQAAKTDDPEWKQKILDAVSPHIAKKLGRQCHKRENWENERVDVMRQLVREKFSHSDLRARLLATGDAHLEEGNYWKDVWWGVCNGVGENWLGKILMEVRSELRENQAV